VGPQSRSGIGPLRRSYAGMESTDLAVGRYGSTTILPLRWLVMLASSAAAVCASGNVRTGTTLTPPSAVRDHERNLPKLSDSAYSIGDM
jgi:hypothetical protein